MTGSWKCLLDAKGRLAVPAKLRTELGERFYVTKGVDGCLSAYSEEGWLGMEAKIAAMPSARARVLRRMLFANAVTCEPDAQGRIIIPKELREYASLEREISFIGIGESAEIWDSAKWDSFNAGMTAEDLAAALDE